MSAEIDKESCEGYWQPSSTTTHSSTNISVKQTASLKLPRLGHAYYNLLLKQEVPADMPHLLALAHEILYLIIEVISPDDIENFGLSCHALHTLAGPTLIAHRQLRQTYRTVEFDEGDWGDDWGDLQKTHPIYLLRDVLEDFRIRHYPAVLRIGEYIEDWALTDGYDEKGIEEREHESAKAQEAASDCLPLIIKEVVGCPFIRAVKQGEWIRRILEGQKDEVFAMLLILPPNLATTEIQGSFHSAFRIMLKKIAHAYHDPEKKYPLVLTRLTNALVAPNNETDSDGPWESFAALGAFAALPSIRSLSGSFLVSGGPDEEDVFEWSYSSRISGLTELTIKYSNVYGSSGPSFLSGIKSLQRFTYSRGGVPRRLAQL